MKLSRDINNTMLTILLLSFLCSFTLSARMPRRRMGVTVKVSDLVQGQSQVTTVSSNAAVQVKKGRSEVTLQAERQRSRGQTNF